MLQVELDGGELLIRRLAAQVCQPLHQRLYLLHLRVRASFHARQDFPDALEKVRDSRAPRGFAENGRLCHAALFQNFITINPTIGT